MLNIVIYGILFGIVLIPITYIAGFVAKMFTRKPSLPEICSTWNEFYIMELTLFFAGFLMHLCLYFSGMYSLSIKF